MKEHDSKGRARMFTRLTACFAGLVGLAVLAALLETSVASPTTWPRCSAPTGEWPSELRNKLQVKVCGPKKVIRSANYSYTILLTNRGTKAFRGVELLVAHYEPITSSSLPYRRKDMDEALWTVGPLKAGGTFRLGIRLPFVQHNDPRGSNFVVEARARSPRARVGLTKDVVFVRRSP